MELVNNPPDKTENAKGLQGLQRLAKVFTPLAFFLFCCITTCNLNLFLFGFHVMEIHKIVQIGEVK